MIQFQFNAPTYLHLKVHQNVSRLYKDFLFVLEDLRAAGDLPEEEFQRLRKRVLDLGNGAERELHDEIDKFDITE